MGKKPPLTDRLVARIKDNRVAAIVIIAGAALGGVAAFTDSVQKLISLVPHREVVIDGEWHSAVFTDSSLGNPEPTQYYFQLRSQGGVLFGTVRAVDPPDHPTGRVYAISDGKVDGRKVSWSMIGGWSHENEDGSYTPLKELFSGMLVAPDSMDVIHEVYGGSAVEFTARRVRARAR